MNYCAACITGLVEQQDLSRVLSHMECGGARLAIHVYLQGHVRDRGAAQPNTVSHHRIPCFRRLSRVHNRVRIRLLLPGDVRLIRRHRLLHVFRSQARHQQYLHVADLEPRQWRYIQSVLDGGVRPMEQLSTSSQLLLRSVHSAKLELSKAI